MVTVRNTGSDRVEIPSEGAIVPPGGTVDVAAKVADGLEAQGFERVKSTTKKDNV